MDQALLSREILDAAISEAERQLGPPNAADLADAIDALLEYSRMFNIPTEPRALSAIYRHAGMSARMIREGIPLVLSTWNDSFRLPSPGAVKETMQFHEARWIAELAALKALKIVKPSTAPQIEDREATEAEKAETARITANALASLKSRSIA